MYEDNQAADGWHIARILWHRHILLSIHEGDMQGRTWGSTGSQDVDARCKDVQAGACVGVGVDGLIRVLGALAGVKLEGQV